MITALFVALLAGCAGDAPTAQAPAVAPASSSPTEVADVLPGDSVYQLSAPLEDQRGQSISLDTFRGHPVIISMFYASCPMACPLLIQDIGSVEGRLSPQLHDDLRVLLVSLDPERDSPDKLREVIRNHDLDPERWALTRTDADHVRQIAAVLGIRYRGLANGEMNHSSILTVLDRDGRIVLKQEGLGGDGPERVAKGLAGI